MEHLKITIPSADSDERAILIALMESEEYDGFEEQEEQLLAYCESGKFNSERLSEMLSEFGKTFTTELVPDQNWNEEWESNFEPVIIEGICTIRAAFHEIEVDTPYEIEITPKMSFGTGHHSTTRLMIKAMADLDMQGRSVLDLGTGTGVLAIFAELRGAESVIAVDNDEWAYENTLENIACNHCKAIEVRLGSMEDVGERFDLILANINRHILLQYMQHLFDATKEGGKILLSGLLTDDQEIIAKAAVSVGFRFLQENQHGGWISLLFEK